VRVKDINPGAAGAFEFDLREYAVVDGTLFFTADDGTTGRELWKTDGTPAGTVLVTHGPIRVRVGNMPPPAPRLEVSSARP
jgi:hypothetical protein